MKTVIAAINSKHIHSSLAPWYLKAYCGNVCGEIKVLEFSINDHPDNVLAAIYREKADVAAFSCYIWNIEYVLKAAEYLKEIAPGTIVVMGGPEVSFDSEELMQYCSFIDYIIKGEGEASFKSLLASLQGNGPVPGDAAGIVSRDHCGTVEQASLIKDLDTIPSPYTDEMLEAASGRIVYYESSRGCPYSCSYCLSSASRGVRYFSMPRVKNDLDRFISLRVRQVKFVDRTFNCNRARAMEIIRHIMGNPGETSFHFEIAADLFDEELIDLLASAPAGLMQFEIGIQTTNEKTLELINRKTDLDAAFGNIRRLRSNGNIHLHLDLIAGLPGEDYTSFKESFDRVHGLKPHYLQLGFLKMLKGTRMRAEAKQHGYGYKSHPPYEVLFSSYMSYEEILELKAVEEVLSRYYNSGRFHRTLEYLLGNTLGSTYGSAFEFYRELASFYADRGHMTCPPSSRELYTILAAFLAARIPGEKFRTANELLKLDFLASNHSDSLPARIERVAISDFKERCHNFLSKEENIKLYLQEFENLPRGQIMRYTHFEIFEWDVTCDTANNAASEKEKTVVLFNYLRRDKVTGLYHYTRVYI